VPEGHTVHRIALQFDRDFVGRRVAATSPQGRFAAGAALLDGRTMTRAMAVGKQLFLQFRGDRRGQEPWLRVHLGLYGAWDFHGRVSAITPGSRATGSLGAPRLRRAVRIAEYETALPPEETDGVPPAPVGQVRVRLLAARPERRRAPAWSLADLRGPTACEVIGPDDVQRVVAKLGPDPVNDVGTDAREGFVRAAGRRAVPIGRLLMDPAVVSGIGNVYRAELLFRARLNPFLPGRQIGDERLAALWEDWSVLLHQGVDTGVMLTRDGLVDGLVDRLVAGAPVAAEVPAEERHYVYRRHGQPCRVCGTPVSVELVAARKLYWCRRCQA
jgi:endonuclease-8